MLIMLSVNPLWCSIIHGISKISLTFMHMHISLIYKHHKEACNNTSSAHLPCISKSRSAHHLLFVFESSHFFNLN